MKSLLCWQAHCRSWVLILLLKNTLLYTAPGTWRLQYILLACLRHKASWYASSRMRVTLPWRVITIAFGVIKGVGPQGDVAEGAEALLVGAGQTIDG